MPRRERLKRTKSSQRRSKTAPPNGASVVEPRLAHSDPALAELINAESALGRTLFGPIPEGHQREFFALRKNTWIWHENWTDQLGRLQEMTIRYEVRPSGVFKRVGSGTYQKINGAELSNFRLAAHSYLDLIRENLYY